MAQTPVAPGLFTWPAGQPCLVGARCAACETVSFPRRDGCPRCGAEAPEEHQLAPEGTLWTWTSQEFRPKAPYLGADDPEPFVPWYVGLVQLGDEIRVEGRLVGCTAETLSIGMRMRTVVVPFADDAGGDERLTFAFEPVPATEEGTGQ